MILFLRTAGLGTNFALRLGEEELRLRREKFGPEHPDTLSAISVLAISCYDAGRLQEALELQEEVLRIRRDKLGSEHPDTLGSMHNLVISCARARRMEEALVWGQDLLRLSRGSRGQEHPGTLDAMTDLGRTLNALGRLPEALALLRQGCNETHVVAAAVRYNLACYDCLSGKFAEARRLITEEIAANPARKEPALQDFDLAAIHEFIRAL
jgi:tetratricopeptide (TPR) repeat protein